MRIAAVVILYHPDQTAVSNIKSFYAHVEKIFVYDNTEIKSSVGSELIALTKVEFFQDCKNGGIAKRLNEACEKAIDEQFDWILTMDQDTSFSEEAISNYFNCFTNYKYRENTALFGTNFSRSLIPPSNDCNKEKEAEKIITSGMLLSLSCYRKIKSFDEALFIDSVDYDYCFRAKILGYRIVQFPGIYSLHPIGKEVFHSSVKSLFLIRKKKEIHSPLRCYYMYRNMLFLHKKYENEDPKYFHQIKGYVRSRIMTSILYGRNTWNIIRFLNMAKRDFKNNKMGRF